MIFFLYYLYLLFRFFFFFELKFIQKVNPLEKKNRNPNLKNVNKNIIYIQNNK